MSELFPRLFSPLTLRHKTLKHRLNFGAHTANMSEAGLPAERHLGYYTERARGGGYVVSVRAPLENKTGADELCRRFPTGGGRKAAAGINELPESMLDDFIKQFSDFYAAF